ncbi:uncharacterized protein LOC118503621 [Anopheles stephensi]|uniref:uncharacterized protein LOC118503621 n=1 Tax=Anopheles stephensi TaxID=30069 RepID=UPI00165874CA|nr:uncharacterized protein LOC118503621 [Anopheles stephensi]XP_035893000.1 uncharacterized protein LOC118503621 [Anopheles stephensi]XP_035893001.1 uncharacterized protein LOC118503621 [Anopheles stephensi]XP_035893002.1 uncharacterized protein LOC118503621 [Anopheles stephensi]
MYTAMISTAIAAIVGIFAAIHITNKLRNSPHRNNPGAERASNTDEPEPVLCETCHIPQIGDASAWKVFECGHCYHQRCLNLFASPNCYECEVQNAATGRRMGDS